MAGLIAFIVVSAKSDITDPDMINNSYAFKKLKRDYEEYLKSEKPASVLDPATREAVLKNFMKGSEL